ncbi:hypothetical protein C8J57DRAFT_1501789 [Mycena rebaudengoi]|nr:hypothetical protein C8J57DRAFT_1501789 [Mycena rebaudengoi]
MNKVFQWDFAGNALSDKLPSCRNMSIVVKPFDPANETHGIPPFYMMAFAINGTPISTFIGTDESKLSWVVNQPVGSTLLLTVADSQGSSGGVPPKLFTVVPGASTQCIPAASTQEPFTVVANVTDTLTTCQPWGLTIKGGTPPYNLTLAAVNSPVVTNVTMGPLDDAFTFPNRADPGTQLIAAISDLNGRWAFGTPMVNTKGSADTTCTGLVSRSGNSTQIKEEAIKAAAAALAASNSARGKKTATIAGVVVTLLVLLLAGAGVFLYLRRKRLQKIEEITPRQFEEGVAPAFEETGGQVLSINAFISAPSSTSGPSTPEVPQPMTPSNFSSIAPSESRPARAPSSSRSAPQSTSGLSIRNPGRSAAFTSFPSASVRRSAKEIEAGLTTSHSDDSEYVGADSDQRTLISRAMSAGPSSTAGPSGPSGANISRAASLGSTNSSLPGEEIIFQHQDAGLVRELPPPYADRGDRGGSQES